MRLNIVFCVIALPLSLVARIQAQPTTQTNRPTRSVTLDECIRMAMEHNLGLKVARYSPIIEVVNLGGAYSVYDPEFQARASRSFSETEGGFTAGTPVASTKEKTDLVTAGISGGLPWGMTYDLGWDLTHRYGSRGGVDTTGLTNIATTVPTDDYSTSIGLTLEQPLLRNFWTDAARTDINVQKTDVRISQENFRIEVMNLVRDVQNAYYELIGARDQVKVREKAVELKSQLQAENKRKVEVGTLAPLDEKQAEAELAEARANLMLAQREVLFRENTLRDLITEDYKEWYQFEIVPAEVLVAVPITANRVESWMRAFEQRPDIIAKKLELERQGIILKFEKNQLLPALNLVAGGGLGGRDTMMFGGTTNQIDPKFSRAFDDIQDQNNPSWSLGAVFSVPLSNRRARYSTRAARERLAQVDAELKKLNQDVLVSVENAITQVDSTFEQIGARRQTRLFREAALDAEQKKLENGKSTSFQVLELQNDLTTARAAEIEALSEYNKALVDLYYSEGSILEKNKVKTE